MNPLLPPQASLGNLTTLKTLRYFPSLSSVLFLVELTLTTRRSRRQLTAPERFLMIVISGVARLSAMLTLDQGPSTFTFKLLSISVFVLLRTARQSKQLLRDARKLQSLAKKRKT